jgi:hypothetical protein
VRGSRLQRLSIRTVLAQPSYETLGLRWTWGCSRSDRAVARRLGGLIEARSVAAAAATAWSQGGWGVDWSSVGAVVAASWSHCGWRVGIGARLPRPQPRSQGSWGIGIGARLPRPQRPRSRKAQGSWGLSSVAAAAAAARSQGGWGSEAGGWDRSSVAAAVVAAQSQVARQLGGGIGARWVLGKQRLCHRKVQGASPALRLVMSYIGIKGVQLTAGTYKLRVQVLRKQKVWRSWPEYSSGR